MTKPQPLWLGFYFIFQLVTVLFSAACGRRAYRPSSGPASVLALAPVRPALGWRDFFALNPAIKGKMCFWSTALRRASKTPWSGRCPDTPAKGLAINYDFSCARKNFSRIYDGRIRKMPAFGTIWPVILLPDGIPLKPADASPGSLSNASRSQIKICQRSLFLIK